MDKNKLFIGNISIHTQMSVILEKFGEFGVISDSYKPEGKVFAFITFESDSSAEQAVSGMDGYELDGRELRVSVAQPKKESTRSAGTGRNGFRNKKGRYD